MTGNQIIFQGNAQIHLYGKNALIPVCLNHQVLTSIIGVEGSDLIVNDHRDETIQAIKNSSSNDCPINFIEAFNRPAKVEVRYLANNQGLEIDLFETSSEMELPVLWMGVLENNLMPAYKVEWEVFKPVDDNNTAFCAMVHVQHAELTY